MHGRFQNIQLLVQCGYQLTRTGSPSDNYMLSPFCHLVLTFSDVPHMEKAVTLKLGFFGFLLLAVPASLP